MLCIGLFCVMSLGASFVPSPWWSGSMLELDVRWPKAASHLGLSNPAPVAAAVEELPEVALEELALPQEDDAQMTRELERQRLEAAELNAQKRARQDKAQLRAQNAKLLAGLEDVKAPKVRLERPCVVQGASGCRLRAMDTFFDALRQTALKTRKTPVRISQYGDSLISGDGFTGRLRRSLQSRFGDGGHGYVPLRAPSRFMGFNGLRVSSSDSWKLDSIGRKGKAPKMLGVGGVSFVPKGPTKLKIQAKKKSRTFDTIGLMAKPRTEAHNVDFRLKTSEAPKAISIAPGELSDHVHWLSMEPTSTIELSNFTRATYYGVVVENKGPGIVVDNFGMLSSKASSLTNMNAAHWKQQMTSRGVNLASFSFGTNSAGVGRPSKKWLERYQRVYGHVLKAAQEVSAERDCLVLSILTRASKQDDVITPYPSVKAMVGAQRQSAQQAGCAFWDMNAAIGGEKGPAKWYKHSPRWLGSDLAHPTPKGYGKLAQLFEQALMYEFKVYLQEQSK